MKKNVFKETDNFWILFNGTEYVVGLTKKMQQELGSITQVSLPQAEQRVARGETFLELKAEKLVGEFVSPLTGIVSSVNEKIDLDICSLHAEDELDAWILAFKDVPQEEFMTL